MRLVALAGTFSLKVPSTEEDVPVLVPFTCTDAPGIGEPDSSVILPVKGLVGACALAIPAVNSRSEHNRRTLRNRRLVIDQILFVCGILMPEGNGFRIGRWILPF